MSFTRKPEVIAIETIVKAPIDLVWACWTEPKHIVGWNHASDDWHTTKATIDLHGSGRFSYRMAAKDGSVSFDFAGTFDLVRPNERLESVLDDGRRVIVEFLVSEEHVHVREQFEAEQENSPELQRQGWQAILDNFKSYVEALD